MHACIYTSRHLSIHPSIHPSIRTYIHTYIPTYLATYLHTYIHNHTYMHTYVHSYTHIMSPYQLYTRNIYYNMSSFPCVRCGDILKKQGEKKPPGSADLQVVHVVIFIQDLIRRPSFRTLTNAAGLLRRSKGCAEKRHPEM